MTEMLVGPEPSTCDTSKTLTIHDGMREESK